MEQRDTANIYLSHTRERVKYASSLCAVVPDRENHILGLAGTDYRLIVEDESWTTPVVVSDFFNIVPGHATAIDSLELCKGHVIGIRAESSAGAPIGGYVALESVTGGPRISGLYSVWSLDMPTGISVGPLAIGKYLLRLTPHDPNKKPACMHIEVLDQSMPQTFTLIEGHDDTKK
jgi:hypothetical protein